MRTHRVWLALLLLGAVTHPAASDEVKPKSNIVLIMADDLGFGDVGWNGGPYKTPNLDKLAKKAVRLEQHYSLPTCSPTRSSLLSGRFNGRFGCTGPTNSRVFPEDTVTIARAFRSVGYTTALIGKWHLGSKLEWGPQTYGFDHSYGSLSGGVTSYSHVYKAGEFEKTWHRNGKYVSEEGHVTDLLTREAIRFIETKRDGPFFLYVPYTAVHLPIDEPKEWLDRYADEKEIGVRYYGACITHMDDGIGKIVQALERTGQMDNTIFIFLSDNGGSTGAQNNDTRYAGIHPAFLIPARNGLFRGKKGTLYEGGIRTPAFIILPGSRNGRDEPTPFHVADWFPTLASVVGYQTKADLKWDGQNLWPVLTGAKRLSEPRTLYWLGGNDSSLLRHGDWTLVRQKNKADELYNLAQDPRQQKDLAATEPQRLQEMRSLRERAAQADTKLRLPGAN